MCWNEIVHVFDILVGGWTAKGDDVATEGLGSQEHCFLFQVARPGRCANAYTFPQAMNFLVDGPGWHTAHHVNSHAHAIRIKLTDSLLQNEVANRPVAHVINGG